MRDICFTHTRGKRRALTNFFYLFIYFLFVGALFVLYIIFFFSVCFIFGAIIIWCVHWKIKRFTVRKPIWCVQSTNKPFKCLSVSHWPAATLKEYQFNYKMYPKYIHIMRTGWIRYHYTWFVRRKSIVTLAQRFRVFIPYYWWIHSFNNNKNKKQTKYEMKNGSPNITSKSNWRWTVVIHPSFHYIYVFSSKRN